MRLMPMMFFAACTPSCKDVSSSRRDGAPDSVPVDTGEPDSVPSSMP